jgi:phage shock protein A
MSQNETPENRLEQASQVVAQWRDRIQTITQNIADTEQKAAESKLNRQNYVLGATLGDVQHKKELDRLRQAHDTAQLTLSDLNAALPLAHAELKAAIAEHKSAENAVKAVTVKRLAPERVNDSGTPGVMRLVSKRV